MPMTDAVRDFIANRSMKGLLGVAVLLDAVR